MSSRLIPPNDGPKYFTQFINSSGSSTLTQISIAYIPANLWNNTALPSITGLPAKAPMFPKPSTAVPLLITATEFPFRVY